jgi:hypothetical protein
LCTTRRLFNAVALKRLRPRWFAVRVFKMMNEPSKPENRAQREERLRAALRENLKRRKAQARGRTAPSEPNIPDKRGPKVTDEQGER